MNIFKKGLFAGATALAMSMSAQAAIVDVGGVVWDTEETGLVFPGEIDFSSHGSITENAVAAKGDILSGFGEFSRVNSLDPNQASFCPGGCELTFVFTAVLDSFVGTPTGIGGSIDGIFTFKDLVIDIYVDDASNYAGTSATAGDGDLWLKLTSGILSGTGDNLGSGSDTGNGTSLLDVAGGLAAAYFDTNGEAGGADMFLNSSFDPVPGTDPALLSGTFDLDGNSIAIPEPTSLALLGLGLLGLAGARKRKA